MNNWKLLLFYCIAFIVAEVIAFFCFALLRKQFKVEDSAKKHHSVIKGFLERLVVYLGLILGVQSIVIVFGTLKIATRIKSDDDEKISNNYFLTGNFLSILFVFLSVLINKLLMLLV